MIIAAINNCTGQVQFCLSEYKHTFPVSEAYNATKFEIIKGFGEWGENELIRVSFDELSALLDSRDYTFVYKESESEWKKNFILGNP